MVGPTRRAAIATDPYRRIATVYDRVIDPVNRSLWDIAIRLRPPESGDRVLDVGCGTGSALARYRDAGYDPAGIDLSEAMLAKARARLGADADLRVGDALALPYPDDSFDLVTAAYLVHEVPVDLRPRLLHEIARVAGPEGEILLIDQHPGPIRGLSGRVRQTITTVVERAAGREHFRNYREFMRSGGIPTQTARVGLTIDREKIIADGNVGMFVAVTTAP